MSRRDLIPIAAAAVLVLLAASSAPAFPQDAANAEATEGDAGAVASAPTPTDSATVETIFRQQEELLRGERFAYDPSGRRDPFRSLLEKVTLTKGPRPKGIAGMMVAEIQLVGIVRDDRGGDVGFFMGPDAKGYFLRVGDEVYDGTVISIDPRDGVVMFRQQVDDPRLIKPYRDVAKRLVPEDEENSNE